MAFEIFGKAPPKPFYRTLEFASNWIIKPIDDRRGVGNAFLQEKLSERSELFFPEEKHYLPRRQPPNFEARQLTAD